jgi:hypothetical protein
MRTAFLISFPTFRPPSLFSSNDIASRAAASFGANGLKQFEGYIVCQKKYGNPMAVFSQSAEWYVAQISQWYGIKADDPGEISEKRSPQKIADVLYWFKDDR